MSCNDISAQSDGSARSSFDCNCSPFGKYNGGGGSCANFFNMRHWRQ